MTVLNKSIKDLAKIYLFYFTLFCLQAANGANASTIVGVIREYRGLSWSVGGEGVPETTLTLPSKYK